MKKKPILDKSLQPEDEGYIENDLESILERLNCGYVAYLQIHSVMNMPLLLKKDIVALRKNEHYKVRDIVFYQVEEYYFLRRIVAIENGNYYVCGDNEYEVRVIPFESIIARAISRERGGKKRLSLILMNKKKVYSRAVIRKGKFRMKNHTLYDDETTLTKVYDKALTANESVKVVQEVKKPEMPLDARLSAQLVSFVSPVERLRSFQAERNQQDPIESEEDTMEDIIDEPLNE
ncbi:MAG: hypothetical protein K2O05_00255, partial [Anaeroplasmataceae bacterium]|nr:hypothetical protein [Anaeroplasmataceae bacterium]